MSDEPLFTPRGPDFVPTEHTRGPWDPRHQHGGAVAALVARALGRTAGPGIGVSLGAGDLEVGVAGPNPAPPRRTELPTGEGHHSFLEPGPEGGIDRPFVFEDGDRPAFHRTGMEIRFVGGCADQPGPAKAWFRLRRPVVGDEEPTGVQRAAAAADFGNGVSWVLPPDRWIFVNPDLTLHLARPPHGEWIGLDALTVPSDEGMALAESAVYDERGRLGRAAQSLLLQARDAG